VKGDDLQPNNYMKGRCMASFLCEYLPPAGRFSRKAPQKLSRGACLLTEASFTVPRLRVCPRASKSRKADFQNLTRECAGDFSLRWRRPAASFFEKKLGQKLYKSFVKYT
jgi:hypothetical protein